MKRVIILTVAVLVFCGGVALAQTAFCVGLDGYCDQIYFSHYDASIGWWIGVNDGCGGYYPSYPVYARGLLSGWTMVWDMDSAGFPPAVCNQGKYYGLFRGQWRNGNFNWYYDCTLQQTDQMAIRPCTKSPSGPAFGR